MNSKIGAVYVVAMVMAMLMDSSVAIDCYNCTDCGDPLVTTGIPSCRGFFCSKIRSSDGGTPVIQRTCSRARSDEVGCYDIENGETPPLRVCFCSTDYCNDFEGMNLPVKPLAASTAVSIFNPTVKPHAASAAVSIFNPTVKLLAALSAVSIFSMRLPVF